jgi:hypothetical protein
LFGFNKIKHPTITQPMHNFLRLTSLAVFYDFCLLYW